MTLPEQKLRAVLKVNGATSIISGLLLIFLSDPIAQLLSASESVVLVYVGIGLVIFSISVFVNARVAEIKRNQVQFIILQDWLWVVGSVALILFQFFNLSVVGYVLIGVMAVAVGTYAILQGKYLSEIVGRSESA
ncbi:MAG: hypothetical protein KDD67_06965 [Ignavibacteriae bacterium]|nr:hypothetical protein [Ignavibacteriota bacterium]MCB9215217.1 hypothetical protein [Ignavibacteria bacterium]